MAILVPKPCRNPPPLIELCSCHLPGSVQPVHEAGDVLFDFDRNATQTEAGLEAQTKDVCPPPPRPGVSREPARLRNLLRGVLSPFVVEPADHRARCQCCITDDSSNLVLQPSSIQQCIDSGAAEPRQGHAHEPMPGRTLEPVTPRSIPEPGRDGVC